MKVYEVLFLFNKLRIKQTKGVPVYINFAYLKVASYLREFPLNKNINSSDIANMKLTDTMKAKLVKIINMKVPAAAKKWRLKNQLVGIAGIGDKKATQLMKMGLTDIKSLHLKKWQAHINTDTKIWLAYPALKKIPHALIARHEKTITGFPGTKIVGSFLRKKPFSRDIDVMLVSDDKTSLKKYVSYLQKQFTVFLYSQGKSKQSMIICFDKSLPNHDKSLYRVKLDVFLTPKKYRYAMQLYSTGPKKFNIKMRAKARRKKYKLNQFGLFVNKKIILVRSEKDLFRKIGMVYVPPHLRV